MFCLRLVIHLWRNIRQLKIFFGFPFVCLILRFGIVTPYFLLRRDYVHAPSFNFRDMVMTGCHSLEIRQLPSPFSDWLSFCLCPWVLWTIYCFPASIVHSLPLLFDFCTQEVFLYQYLRILLILQLFIVPTIWQFLKILHLRVSLNDCVFQMIEFLGVFLQFLQKVTNWSL